MSSKNECKVLGRCNTLMDSGGNIGARTRFCRDAIDLGASHIIYDGAAIDFSALISEVTMGHSRAMFFITEWKSSSSGVVPSSGILQ